MSLANFMVDVLCDKLDEYEGSGALMYGADMGYGLLEEENVNGSYTFDAMEAINWIGEHFEEVREIVAEIEFSMGAESVPNPFLEPERFMVVVMLETSSMLCSQCALIDENWNNEFELTDEAIATIKQQLEAQRDRTVW